MPIHVTDMTELSLTPSGRKVVEDMRDAGPGYSIMSHIYESGGMTFGDLKVSSHMDDGRLLGILKTLHREGMVKVGVSNGSA